MISCQDAGLVETTDKLRLIPLEGRLRSLATASTGLYRTTHDDRPTEPPLPWYVSRNDASPTVYVGYQGPTLQSSVDHTYDRQSHSSNRVHDHFYRHTYNSKLTTTYD